MGGRVLEHEAKTIFNSGRTEGFATGRINTLAALIGSGLLSVKDAAKTAGITEDEFEKMLATTSKNS